MTERYYVSYAWADESDPTREEKVDAFCEAATRRGIKIFRDKTALKNGDLISEFMAQIGEADRVFVFLSKKYLQSPYCMYELFEMWRNSRQDKLLFRRLVRLFTVDGTKIGKPEERLEYTEYWKARGDALRQKIERVGFQNAGEAIESYRLIEMITSRISDVLALFADVMQPRTFKDFLDYDFANQSAGAEVGHPQVGDGLTKAEEQYIKIQVPNRIDFRTLADPSETSIETWASEQIAVSIIPLVVTVDNSERAPDAVTLRRVELKLREFQEYEIYRWLYVVELSEGGHGFLGRVRDVGIEKIKRGESFFSEIMCRVADKPSLDWRSFQKAAPYLRSGFLTVDARFDFDIARTGLETKSVFITRSWQISNAETQSCIDLCKNNEQALCRFIQPEVINRGAVE